MNPRLVLTAVAVVSTILVGLPAASSAQRHQRYSMADLTALASSSSWDELIEHAGDIAPARRNDAWRALVVRAANGVLENVSDYEAFMRAESLLRSHGFLLQNDEFKTKRAAAAARAIGRCLDESSYDVSPCLDAATQVLGRDPTNHGLAFSLGRVIRLGTSRGPDTTFFRRAVEAQGAPVAQYCADGELQEGVARRFSQVSGATEAADASAIAFGPCFEQLRARLLRDVAEASSTHREIVCPELQRRNALTGAARTACQPPAPAQPRRRTGGASR